MRHFTFLLTDCPDDPLPAKAGGLRSWDNSKDFGAIATYTCPDGMTKSYAYCNGEIWRFPPTKMPCHDGVPPEPQCKVLIDGPMTISSTDPQYLGCRVTIDITDSRLRLIAKKFKVIGRHFTHVVDFGLYILG